MTPYYHDPQSQVTLYCADCRDLLPLLEPVDAIIVDPVWPNAVASLAGSDDPAGLFASAAQHFPRLAKRVVVQLGCDSDPRFLAGMPKEMPFLRVCWLEYAALKPKGRILFNGDVAYAFGDPPPWRQGRVVIPGRMTSTRPDWHRVGAPPSGKVFSPNGTTRHHPAPRRLDVVAWLVRWFADGPILDPFAGIGTTLVAAKYAGYPAVGIEISEDYCRVAVERLAQGVLPFGEKEPG